MHKIYWDHAVKETGNTAGERTGSWFSLWTAALENCLCFRVPGWSCKSDFSQTVINCVFSVFWVHSLKILTLIYLSMLGALFQYSLRALILPPLPRLPRPCGKGTHRLGNKTEVLVCHTQHCHLSLFSHFSSDPDLCTLSFHLPGPCLHCWKHVYRTSQSWMWFPDPLFVFFKRAILLTILLSSGFSTAISSSEVHAFRAINYTNN